MLLLYQIIARRQRYAYVLCYDGNIMSSRPVLSIIIPAYNCGQQIKTIAQSIINQSFEQWELIIVDDHSTDNTGQILAELAKLSPQITIINQHKNGGASVARNAGLKHATGQYLMFLDADDDILPETIPSFIAAITRDKRVDLAVSGFTVRNLVKGQAVSSVDVCTNELPLQLEQEPFRLYILRLLGLDGRLYQVWNKIYRTDIIKKYNLQFQPGLNFGEDLVFNLNYFANMTGQIKFINQPLYIYNQSLDSGTFSRSSLVYANRQSNYDELVKFVADIPNSNRKVSLLSWIQYSWLYSHFLAVSQANLSKSQKIANLQQVAQAFSYPPLSDPTIIGAKRVKLERLLASMIQHPRLCISLMNSANFVKNNRFTAATWRRLRQALNR